MAGITGIRNVHVKLPTCPQAAYRCAHEYLLCQWRSEGSLSAPTLSGGDHKRVPLRSLQQTALPGQNHPASGPGSALLWHFIAVLCSSRASRRPKPLKRNESGL